jgi:hypothetical protein
MGRGVREAEMAIQSSEHVFDDLCGNGFGLATLARPAALRKMMMKRMRMSC